MITFEQPRVVKSVVSELLQKLYDAGDIYMDEYEGFYHSSRTISSGKRQSRWQLAGNLWRGYPHN